MNVLDWSKMKKNKNPISMVTCYDYWSARILSQTDIDCLLVGDSLAMVMYGYPDTLKADIPMMSRHVEAVRRGAPQKFIVADMPFLSFRKGLVPAMDAVELLIQAGANAIKLEGVYGHEEIIKHIVLSGVPVMGHLGLTPQSHHQLGGFKVQGKRANNSESIIAQALTLQELGAFAITLECLDEETALKISETIDIPTIGIGAGKGTDGQVLVLHDLLGANADFLPRFVRRYSTLKETIISATNHYCEDVKKKIFPSQEETYQ